MGDSIKAFNAKRGDDLTLLLEHWAKEHNASLRHCSPWHLKLVYLGETYDIWPTKDKYMHAGTVRMLIRPLLHKLENGSANMENGSAIIEYSKSENETPLRAITKELF
jgi:hypothetical protein